MPVNNVYISADLEYSCPKENCINQSLNIEASNLYYTENLLLNEVILKIENDDDWTEKYKEIFKERTKCIIVIWKQVQ